MPYTVKALRNSVLPLVTRTVKSQAFTVAVGGSSNFNSVFTVTNTATGKVVAYFFNGSRFATLAKLQAYKAARQAGYRRVNRLLARGYSCFTA